VLILVATGTGIAPYRAFWRRFFLEDIEGYNFTGLVWLFMGVANSDAKLYDDELQAILKAYPNQVRCAPLPAGLPAHLLLSCLRLNTFTRLVPWSRERLSHLISSLCEGCVMAVVLDAAA
jgi:hypothetical protein